MAANTLIKVEGLKKRFIVGKQTVEVLRGIDLSIDQGDFAIIFGPSGCGKSTLLHTILGMEKPSEGKVQAEGKDYYGMTEDEMVKYRKANVGIVFQQPIWIKSLNVIENVCFPSRLNGVSKEDSEKRAMDSLTTVKLGEWAYHHPNELSSGQQQRVSVARALTLNPVIIVADEPTGNLDTVAGDELMELLLKLNREEGKTVLMVTHDLEYLKYASKLFHIVDGLKVEEYDSLGAARIAKSMKSKKGERENLTVRDKDFLSKNNKKYGVT